MADHASYIIHDLIAQCPVRLQEYIYQMQKENRGFALVLMHFTDMTRSIPEDASGDYAELAREVYTRAMDALDGAHLTIMHPSDRP